MPACAAETSVRAAFAEQAEWCRLLGSPLTTLVCALMAEREWPDCAVSDGLRGWPGDPRASADAVPLRLCGGLHASARGGSALAASYPPHPLPTPDEMWSAVALALAAADLERWLDSPPQTNEVGRSAALIAGMLEFHRQFPVPVSLLELGASAGLNLQLDRFAFELGGVRIGPAGSPVQIKPEWHGPPPAGSLTVTSRRGVDQSPLDPAVDGARLLAFVWPDQRARIEALEAALDVARAHPLAVDRADAAPWLEARLAEAPREGEGRIVFHSIAFQYFPPATQARVTAAIERSGAEATAAQPLGWLRFERDGPTRDAYLRLRSWPGGEERLLAICHPHAAWINWLGGAPARS